MNEETAETSGAGSLLFVCRLAKGGMGRVDLMVRHEGSFRRLYAVKRLHPHFREDASFRDMFVDEARVAGLIRHANVVSVLDVGEDEQGPYLVMDYVEGLSLSAVVTHHRTQGELLPLPLVLDVASQLARALEAAHTLTDAHGTPLHLVHRDVSPQNVLVGFDGAARLTDFGIAKALGRSTQTSTGLLKGKIGYMAPEQLRFERLDHRSDLFSLGVLLYELASADRLYAAGEDGEGARRILNEPPPDLGTVRDDVPPELVELVFELLAKDRVYRPSSAGEVANRLEAILADQVAEEGPLLLSDYMSEVFAEKRAEHRAKVAEATEAAIARRPESKRRGRAVVIAAAVGLAIVGAGGAFWLASASDDIAQERDAADAVEPVGAVAAAPPSPAPKSNQRQHTAPDSEPVGGTRADVPQQGPRGRRRENGRAANDATRASDGGSNRTSARPARRRRRPASRRARRDKDGIPMWSWE